MFANWLIEWGTLAASRQKKKKKVLAIHRLHQEAKTWNFVSST